MIVLTGGAGFIGSCFLWKLNQEGIDDILVVDRLGTSEKWRNLEGKSFRDFMLKDDFLAAMQEHKLPKPTHVIHMGACSSTTNTDADYYVKNNYEYSKLIAEWALSNKAVFMYASSAATYGDGESGYSDDIASIKELKPLNMYGYSKHMFDMWLLRHGLMDKVTGFKFFNVFGPNEYHKGEMRSVVCKAFPTLVEEGVVRLFKSFKEGYADGGQKRDFVYIKDVVDVMFYFFNNPKKTGIFNLGTGQAKSWNDLATAMFAARGEKPNIEYIDMPEHLISKYQYFTEAKMDKLRDAGCDHEFMSLEDSVKDYMGYLAEQAIL